MAEKDIISKDIFKHIAVDLANLLFNCQIQPQDKLTILETEHQRIQDRRADLVLEVKPVHKTHIEIQNSYHPQMVHRMLSYYLDISAIYPKTPIYQYVVYIGKMTSPMKNQLQQDQIDYQYTLLDIQTIKCRDLMRQGTPDALVLAILCDFGEKSPQTMVNSIVKGLSECCADNDSEYRRYLIMLEILADNRDLKNQVKEAEEMITQIQIENLPSYEIGMEKGLERGMERGLERGMEKGKIKAEQEKAKAKQEKLISAQKLLSVLDDQMIASSLNLSLDLVKELRAKNLK